MATDASASEAVKDASRHLRGSIGTELTEDTPKFSGDAATLLKFHGVYQQDDRDLRRQRTAKREELEYLCMVRTSVPGGVLDADQWLAMDRLADEVGNGTLRITTRQGVQYHFTHKRDLHSLIHALNEHLVTTLGACGDVVRNVTCCPAPVADRDQDTLLQLARSLATRFRPRTRAYWELWVDGEKAVSAEEPADPAEEPFYGTTYLPRKFKMGFAWPGDNCIDVYTNDTGMVPAPGPDGRDGFVVLVGGGLGMGHADPGTYPRLSTPLCWADPAELGDVVEAVVATQRDHGNRSDRKKARLKYLLDERGLDWFRSEVEARLGRALTPPQPVAPWVDAEDHLGWHRQADGRWFLGVHVDNGRVRDDGEHRQRSGIRAVVERFRPGVRLTARQDVLFTDVDERDRAAVEAVLREHGVPLAEELEGVRRHAMACPALPTCGLALSEAERALPGVVDVVETELADAGLGRLPVRLNMTGCPNGCARPYTAEIGIVGRTKKGYDVYLGGSVPGTRLAERLAVDVKIDKLGATLRPVFERYRDEAAPGEGFGDFCDRIGVAAMTKDEG